MCKCFFPFQILELERADSRGKHPPIREENSSFSHEERGILIQGIPREENIQEKRGIDQSKMY